MKPRTIILTLEVKTDAPLSVLRTAKSWARIVIEDNKRVVYYYPLVTQAQANVVEPRDSTGARGHTGRCGIYYSPPPGKVK